MLVDVSNPILHIAYNKNKNDFDQIVGGSLVPVPNYENAYTISTRNWLYIKEGKSMVAIHMDGGSQWHAVEVATEGVEYPDFGAFQSASRSFSNGNTFTSGTGMAINASDSSTYIDGNLPRLAAGGSAGTLVSWSGKTMTVSEGGSCTYDFNSLTTSPDGCEGAGGPLGGGGDPKCPDGYCNGTETVQSCPADCDVVDPPPNPQCSDGVDNDSDGAIDLSDPGCSSPSDNDESNGGGGQCPTSCMGEGGDGCSDSLQNATELVACSTGYCQPNYAPMNYCVQCQAGFVFNTITSRCEGGSGGSNPPNKPVLGYKGKVSGN